VLTASLRFAYVQLSRRGLIRGRTSPGLPGGRPRPACGCTSESGAGAGTVEGARLGFPQFVVLRRPRRVCMLSARVITEDVARTWVAVTLAATISA
jgi:hypothetical protein